ncbi:hypothetical protein EFK68_02585 [Pseudomonas aeruginosa]|nr:hypothetical protein EFK68_02585 [Pseudomonas aeruginosa]
MVQRNELVFEAVEAIAGVQSEGAGFGTELMHTVAHIITAKVKSWATFKMSKRLTRLELDI